MDKVKKIREEVKKLHGNPYYMMAVKDVLAIIDPLQEEPVSEDLEEAAIDYDSYRPALYGEDDEGDYVEYIEVRKDAFIAGANWQKEQFEKNRLTHCDAQTEEEAEIERDFVMSIIEKEHRQPTFDDAIKYGMRLKEKEMQSTIELAEDHAMLAGMEKMKDEMMAKAVDGVVAFDYYGDDDKTYGLIAHDSFCLEDFGLKDTDKVKMILIKED